jgi:DNA helicase II / ATP-dependent DNA helicase PcrA
LAERDGDISEERRLFYVAVTRAKSRLFLTQAERRMRQGFYEQSKTSPFFNEIPPGLLRIEKSYSIASNRAQPFKKSFIPRAPTAAPTKSSSPAATTFGTNVDRQASGGKFSSGDKIMHSNFGKGRVLRLEGEGDSQRIHILFEDGKTRKFILKFTALKHV